MATHCVKAGWNKAACGVSVTDMTPATETEAAVTCENCRRVMVADDAERLLRAWRSIKSKALRRLYFMRAGINPGAAKKYSNQVPGRWPVAVRSAIRRQLISHPAAARLLNQPCIPIARGGQHDQRSQVQEAWRQYETRPVRYCRCGGAV